MTAALPPSVGWKLIDVVTPMAGGMDMPIIVTGLLGGALTWNTPPAMIWPERPRVLSSMPVSSGVLGVPAAEPGPKGVPLAPSAWCRPLASWTASPIPR